MLLSTEGGLYVSIDYYDIAWFGHLEFEISIVWHRIESSKMRFVRAVHDSHCERGISKIKSLLRKLSGDPKTTSNAIEPVQRASTPGIPPLKVVFVGLILDGSMPILRTVS